MKKDFTGKLVLVDAGHGGVIGTKYQTPGKRSYFKDGKLMDVSKLGVDYCEKNCDSKYYEGVGNRLIREIVMKKLRDLGIVCVPVTTGNEDVRLTDRVKIINNYANKFGTENCLVISIHSDAFSKESAHGWSCYTTKGVTESDKVSTAAYKIAQKKWPKEKLRKDTRDGDPDKEANFYIIAKCSPRAVLFENFFMTNYKDFTTHLNNLKGREKIADVIVETIIETL
jgi:N-acetylmuramoyl-L-alanine amidase